jgi:folate-binding Fe-S cluster repair protein YgfZ
VTGPVAVVRPRRIAWVEGPDARALLHGLLTADVAALAVGQALRSLVLTTHGHVVAGMAVAREGDEAFTLLLDPAPTLHPVAESARHTVASLPLPPARPPRDPGARA